MNICFLTEENITGPEEPQIRGGIIYVSLMYSYLSRKHNPVILCWKNKFSFKPPIYSIKNLGRVINFFTFLFMAYKIGKEREIDVFISKTRKSLLPGFIAGKLLSRPHVVHVGTLPEKGRGFIDRVDKGVYRSLLRIPHDKYLAVGETVRDTLIEMGVEPFKIYNVSNAVDTNLFKKQDKFKCREELELPKGKIITFVGGFHKYKGVYPALRAFSKIKNEDAYLLMVGDGPERENLKREVESKKINDRVVFYGKVRYDEMPMIYGASDVVILPSYIEGTSRTIMESLACEVPVVATRVGGNSELVKDSKNGFIVEPGDIEDLKNKIVILLNNKDLRLKMGIRAREELKKYSWEKLAKTHEKILGGTKK